MTRIDPWSPRHAYLYLVCIVTLIMAVVGTVNLVRSVVELAYPQPSAVAEPIKIEVGVTDANAAAIAKEQQIYQEKWSMRSAVLALVGNVTMLLIAGPLYLYHWRKIERERAAARQSAARESEGKSTDMKMGV